MVDPDVGGVELSETPRGNARLVKTAQQKRDAVEKRNLRMGQRPRSTEAPLCLLPQLFVTIEIVGSPRIALVEVSPKHHHTVLMSSCQPAASPVALNCFPLKQLGFVTLAPSSPFEQRAQDSANPSNESESSRPHWRRYSFQDFS